MLAITVEFLHGTFRATDADDLTITRQPKPTGEWPPAPVRLFAALVAADGTGARQTVTDGLSDLDALAAARPPRIRASSLKEVASTHHQLRYVIVNERKDNTSQNYPARGNQGVAPGVTSSAPWPYVEYLWDDVDLHPHDERLLKARCARIGYLGCADSPVRVRVGRAPAQGALATWWEPDRAGDATVGVPGPGLIEALDAAYLRFSGGGVSRRAWTATPMASYRSPDGRRQPRTAGPTTVWLRFDRAIDGRKVLAVADTLRSAVLEHVERVLGDRALVPSVLHGHGHHGEVARWIPLPHAGHRYADGRIRGACIWLPPDTPADVIAEVHDAAASVSSLVKPGVFAVDVMPFDGAERPLATNPQRWTSLRRRFATVFPALYERRVKRPLELDDLRVWCNHAGLPEPVWFRAIPVPAVTGGASLHPHQMFRRADQGRPYTHLEIEFGESVAGPVVIGRGRQYGLGLMVPWEAPS